MASITEYTPCLPILATKNFIEQLLYIDNKVDRTKLLAEKTRLLDQTLSEMQVSLLSGAKVLTQKGKANLMLIGELFQESLQIPKLVQLRQFGGGMDASYHKMAEQIQDELFNFYAGIEGFRIIERCEPRGDEDAYHYVFQNEPWFTTKNRGTPIEAFGYQETNSPSVGDIIVYGHDFHFGTVTQIGADKIPIIRSKLALRYIVEHPLTLLPLNLRKLRSHFWTRQNQTA